MTSHAPQTTAHASIAVDVGVERAFSVFTDGIDSW
jgi:hypothetical protein